ncbi:hypothetical protein Gorai_016340, partial [Gossypium raimondii]|nr:hypothetical protein [Gossypium raimondii]
MVVFVYLDRLLVSQVLVNSELVRVEYEALPTICFSCRKYGHLKEICPSLEAETGLEIGKKSDNPEPSNSMIDTTPCAASVGREQDESSIPDSLEAVGSNLVHNNPVFDGHNESKGCASLKFHRVFQEYSRKHKPNLIGRLEKR